MGASSEIGAACMREGAPACAPSAAAGPACAPAGAPEAPQVCVLAGSPRRHGASGVLAACVARGVERAGCRALLLRLADLDVAGCTGCGACERTGECVLPARLARTGRRDGAAEALGALEASDALALVAPVYFAGPPSQLKALLDRLQPLWCRRYLLRTRPVLPVEARKPLDLVVVGSGGDPFGYDPLVTSCRSALRMADFELRALRDAVGYRAPVGPDAAAPDASRRPDDASFERAAEAWGADLARFLLARRAESRT